MPSHSENETNTAAPGMGANTLVSEAAFEAWFDRAHPETNALHRAGNMAASGNKVAAREGWKAALAAQPAPVVGGADFHTRFQRAANVICATYRREVGKGMLLSVAELLAYDVLKADELLAARPGGEGSCEWVYDEDDGAWDSACGRKWSFVDGGPEENNYRFCHGCGKPIAHPAQAGGDSAAPLSSGAEG